MSESGSAAKERPRVSVVVVVKNELPNLRQNIPVLQAQTPLPPDEVVVIDSGSTDGSVAYVREVAAEWPALRLVEIPPADFHHARTRNLGAALTSGPFLVYLGGDAIPTGERWLAELLAPFECAGDERIAASYGRQVPDGTADLPNRVRMAFNYPAHSSVRDRLLPISPKERYAFSSVSCCIQRETLGGRPPFDEHLPVNEDMTLSRRLIDEGGAIAYRAESVVVHSHNYSSREVFRRFFDNGVTYRKLGIFRRGERTVAGDGAGLLRRGREELRGHGPVEWARFAAFYLAAGAGLQLGLYYEWLPRALARRISRYGTV